MKRPEHVRCDNCAGWNEPTRECRAKGPEWIEDYPEPIWPKTKATDWCGWFCDDWNLLQEYQTTVDRTPLRKEKCQ